MTSETGKWILIIGIGITAIGALLYWWPGIFQWVGRLPGDIRIERENFRFYFPITTLLLLTLLINLILRLIKWWNP